MSLFERLERALYERKLTSRENSPSRINGHLSPGRGGSRTPKSTTASSSGGASGASTPPSREHELDYDETRRYSLGALQFDERRRPSHDDRLPGTPPPIGRADDPPHHIIFSKNKKPAGMECFFCRRQMSYESNCKLCPRDHNMWCSKCVEEKHHEHHNSSHPLYDLTIRRPRYVGGYAPVECSICDKYYEIAHDHYTGARCDKCEEHHLDICGECLLSKEKNGYEKLIAHEQEFHKDIPASWTLFRGPGLGFG